VTRKELALYLNCSSATVSRILQDYDPPYRVKPNKGRGIYDYLITPVQLKVIKQELEDNKDCKGGAPKAREYSMEIFKVF